MDTADEPAHEVEEIERGRAEDAGDEKPEQKTALKSAAARRARVSADREREAVPLDRMKFRGVHLFGDWLSRAGGHAGADQLSACLEAVRKAVRANESGHRLIEDRDANRVLADVADNFRLLVFNDHGF